MTDLIPIKRPHVPWGPRDVPELLADADYLDHAARNIEGGYSVGGSNVTRTVIKLLHDTAAALRKHYQETSDERVDIVAAAIAEAADADYWVIDIAEWEGSEQWERDAHPDEHPYVAYEDREEFRKQARAALDAARQAGGDQ